MKRLVLSMLAVSLVATASAAERRKGRTRRPAAPRAPASPPPAPSPAPPAIAVASPLEGPLERIAAGHGAAVEADGRARVARKADDPVGHAMIGLAVKARASKARFRAGIPAPDGQDPLVWDAAAVDEAAKELAAALTTDPALAPAAGALVDLLVRAARGDQAVAVVKEHAPVFDRPVAAAALEAALHVLREKGQEEQALAIADLWMARRPADPIVRRATAHALVYAGGLERARATTRRFRSSSKDPAFALALGEVDVLAGQPGRAVAAFAGAAPSSRRAEWLAVLSGLASSDPKSRARLKAVAASARPGEEPLAELGWLLDGALDRPPTTQPAQLEDALRDNLAARRPVEAALALAARRRLPGAGARETVLDADIAVAVRDRDRERRLLRPLIGKSAPGAPADGVLRFRVGRSLFHEKRDLEAVSEWKKAIAAGKDDAEVNFHLGLAYERLGRRDEMLLAYRKASAWRGPGPHVQQVKDALARLGVK